VKKRDSLLNAVTLDEARRVARRLYGGPGFLTVVVGQPDGITATEPAPAVY
jgi:zinc protease